MPRKKMTSGLPVAQQVEYARLHRFIQEHKNRINGLGSRVAEATGYSAGMVSQTLNGYVENYEIIRAAHKEVCRHLGLPDPYVMESILGLSGAISAEVQELVSTTSRVQELNGLFSNTLLTVNNLLDELEAYRRQYRTSRRILESLLDTGEDSPYPDQLETSVRESLANLLPIDAQPKATGRQFRKPGIQDSDETPEEFAIRSLKEQGYLTEEGTLSDGQYQDPVTGEILVLGRD